MPNDKPIKEHTCETCKHGSLEILFSGERVCLEEERLLEDGYVLYLRNRDHVCHLDKWEPKNGKR